MGGRERASQRFRKPPLASAARLRAPEDAAEAERGARAPLAEADWRRYWPS